MENQKFKKILSEKEFHAIVEYMKSQPVAWKILEPIANSLLQLPDLEESKKKEAK
tara:strand:- start:870 stop:1034 length:165 start_codon:yes stop_codon:yes gene_type:complete